MLQDASSVAMVDKADQNIDPAKNDEKSRLSVELDNARVDLAALLTRYTELHPRVKAQRLKIADLETELAKRRS